MLSWLRAVRVELDFFLALTRGDLYVSLKLAYYLAVISSSHSEFVHKTCILRLKFDYNHLQFCDAFIIYDSKWWMTLVLLKQNIFNWKHDVVKQQDEISLQQISDIEQIFKINRPIIANVVLPWDNTGRVVYKAWLV